jgi:hypothetical protein
MLSWEFVDFYVLKPVFNEIFLSWRNRGQRSEVRGQRSEVRGQRSEVRGQRSEVRGQRSEFAKNI